MCIFCPLSWVFLPSAAAGADEAFVHELQNNSSYVSDMNGTVHPKNISQDYMTLTVDEHEAHERYWEPLVQRWETNSSNIMNIIAHGNYTDFAKDLQSVGVHNMSMTGPQTETLLHVAVKYRQVEVVELLTLGVPINASTSYGETALIFAAKYDAIDILRLLLDAGAEVDAEDHFGNTAFYFTVMKGNLEAAGLLLKKNASINHKIKTGFTAVNLATLKGDAAMFDFLYGQGADVTVDTFRLAVRSGLLIVAKFLLQQFSNEIDLTGDHESILHDAVHGDHDDVVDWLLREIGVSVNAVRPCDGTALRTAAIYNSFRAARRLLEEKNIALDILGSCLSGWTALEIAERKGHYEIAQLIREHKTSMANNE